MARKYYSHSPAILLNFYNLGQHLLGLRLVSSQSKKGISLYIPTVQDVDAVASRIKAAGGELAMEPTDMPWGTRAFRLVDPDGFNITIARAMD